MTARTEWRALPPKWWSCASTGPTHGGPTLVDGGTTLVGNRAHGDDVTERRERVVAVVRAAHLDLPPLRTERRQANVTHRKVRRGISRRIAPIIIEVRTHPHLPEGW